MPGRIPDNKGGFMKDRSLRFKWVAVSIITVLLPVLVVGGSSIYQSRKALEGIAQSQSAELAKSMAFMVNMALQEELKILVQTSQRDVVIAAATAHANGSKKRNLSRKATAELTAMLKKRGESYDGIFIIGQNGSIVADGLGGNAMNKGMNLSDRDYFKAAMEGRVSVGAVIKSRATGAVSIPFAAPIYSKNGNIVGVVGATVMIDFMSEKISGTRLGKTGYGYMIDNKGVMIAHPKKEFLLALNLSQEEGTEEVARRMMVGETGTQKYTFKGTTKMAGFAPVPLTGWSVCLTQDYDEYMAPVKQLTWIAVIVCLFFLAIAVLAVSYFSRGITLPISQIANDLNDASEQVASASSEVAQAGQILAEGSSEQAAALEETSSSMEEMSSMTKHNADNSAQAKALMGEARNIVEKVDGQMNKMVTAIQEVTKSSEETGKIIKTIDEIAFQTNLLALNAAVEAARAGGAGAGFAVVADEVRNLAMRAAEAAKNTSHLIENTIQTVKHSRDLTEQTQTAFKENIGITNKVAQLVDEIAAASHEQDQGIGQIGLAVTEMDKVIQQNAASAEESASAAEEMNAQAMQMKNFVSHLLAIVEGQKDVRVGSGPAVQEEKSAVLKIGRPAVRKALPAAPHAGAKPQAAKRLPGAPAKTFKKTPVRPDKLIPFEKKDFKDF